MKHVLKPFQGRVNRKYFLIMSLFILGLAVILNLIADYSVKISSPFLALFGFIMLFFVLIYSYSLAIRRLHDFNRSGWYILLNLVPFVNFLLFIILFVMPGTKDSNKYGPKQDF